MDRTLRTLLYFLVGLNMLWVAIFIGRTLVPTRSRPAPVPRLDAVELDKATKYTIYVGLNDKDEYAMLVSMDEALKTLNDIAMKHVEGFTVRRAKGYWKDETGQPTSEDTLVYDFIDATDEQIVAIMKEMIGAVNQNSVLVEKIETRRAFFSGVD